MLKVNNKIIETTKFPNNETLVVTERLNEIINKDSLFVVDFKWYGDEDLISLYFVIKYLKDNSNNPIYLYIQYMPYSRMDRRQNENCFTLKYISEFLNSFIGDKDEVFIVEPHSDVTTELVKNSKRLNVISTLVNKVLEEHPEIDIICYPDKGAKNRFKDDKINLPVIYCEKVRDFDTGVIKGLEIVSDVDLKDKNVLIVDDLCSKGGTFYYTSKKLKENGVKDVFLTVCHMESAVKYGKLINNVELIKHIYTTDSMLSPMDSYLLQTETNITIYDLFKVLKEGRLEVQNAK